MLIGAVKLASLGRTLGVKGLQLAAKGKTTGRLGKVAEKARDVAGGVPVPKPGIQRAAEVVGGGAGFGTFSTAEELAAGKPAPEALRTGLIHGAIGASAEAALIGLGRGLTGLAKPRDVAKIKAGFEPKRLEIAALKAENEHLKLRNQLEEILGVDNQEAALAAMRGAPRRAAEELMAKRRAALSLQRSAELRVRDPAVVAYTRDTPYNPESKLAFLQEWMLKVIKAPEAFAGALGVHGAKGFSATQKAEALSMQQTAPLEGVYGVLERQAMKALGLSRKKVDNHGFLDAHHEFELGGPERLIQWATTKTKPISRAKAERAAAAFEEISRREGTVNQAAMEVGGLGPLSLEEFGVQRFLTHSAAGNLTKTQVSDRMRAAGMSEAQIAKIMAVAEEKGIIQSAAARARAADLKRRRGVSPREIGHNGPIDFHRTLHGTLTTDSGVSIPITTLRDKFRAGFPVNTNPFDAALRMEQAGIKRVNYGRALGPQGELVDVLAEGVRREGGDSVLFLNIMDNLLDQAYYSTHLRNFANTVTGLEVASKLTTAVIPNITQPINTIMYLGTKASAKGVVGALGNTNRQRLAQGLAIPHTVLQGVGRSMGEEGLALNGAQKLAAWTLKYTGFNGVERWNRMHTGGTVLAFMRDQLARGLKGNLRGNNLDFTRRRFTDLGIDFDKVIRDARRVGVDDYFSGATWAELETEAIFRAAQKTQFIPSKLRRPQLWNHPIGRIATQFKTFAFGQSKLIRDAVLAEAAHGNLRPLAYFVSFTPIAGEMVANFKSLLKGKDRDKNGIIRALDNSLYAGGFGIAHDVIVSAKQGRLMGTLFGPAVNDFTGFVENLAQGDVQGVIREFERQSATRAARAFFGLTYMTEQAAEDYLEQFGEEETPTFIDLGSLRQREANRKR
jgi:hypothetical protein